MNFQKSIAVIFSFFIGMALWVPASWIPAQMQAAQVPEPLTLLFLVAFLLVSGFVMAKAQTSSGIAMALGILAAYIIAGAFTTETITPWWMMATRFALVACIVYVGHIVGRMSTSRTIVNSSTF